MPNQRAGRTSETWVYVQRTVSGDSQRERSGTLTRIPGQHNSVEIIKHTHGNQTACQELCWGHSAQGAVRDVSQAS